MSAGSISQPFRRNHADRARVETPVLGLARRQGSLKIWLDKDNGWQEHCDRLHAFAVIVGAKGSSGAAYFWTAVAACGRTGEELLALSHVRARGRRWRGGVQRSTLGTLAVSGDRAL